MSNNLIDNSAPGSGPRVRRVFPWMTGLDLVAYMGSDGPTSARNQAARGLAAASIVGSPVYSASHVSLSGLAYIDWAGLTETDSLTIIATMKPTGNLSIAGGRPNVAGWFQNNSTPQGVGIYLTSQTNLRATIPYYVNGVTVSTNLNIGTYASGELLVERLIALSVNAGSGATLYDLTKGVQGSVSTTNLRSLSVGRAFRLVLLMAPPELV